MGLRPNDSFQAEPLSGTVIQELGGMSRLIATRFLSILVAVSVQACAQSPEKDLSSLDSIQGAWWSDCKNSAAEFVVDGDEYSGDFTGRYKLQLSGDVLVLKGGLNDGHSINVSNKPLSFLVLKVAPGQLVLRPMPGNPYVSDWHLTSCDSMPPNSSFKQKRLRGSA